MATMNQTDKLAAAARQALRVLACYDSAGKGGMTFAAWQSKRLAAMAVLKEALDQEWTAPRQDVATFSSPVDRPLAVDT